MQRTPIFLERSKVKPQCAYCPSFNLKFIQISEWLDAELMLGIPGFVEGRIGKKIRISDHLCEDCGLVSYFAVGKGRLISLP